MDDDPISADLLDAHAAALLRGESGFRARYHALFPGEIAELESLFEVAEQFHALFAAPMSLRADFRANLKADLIAQAHQQGATPPAQRWRWAALGASAVTMGMLAAAAWRSNRHRVGPWPR